MGGRIFPPDHKPYTQTHFFSFDYCGDTAKIVHPSGRPDGKSILIHEFVAHIIEAGFEVTGENAEPSFQYDVACGDFGPDNAVTITAVLSGSHVALHGYLEYGGNVEMLFNLCYLPGRQDHTDALEKVGPIFQRWLGARKFDRIDHKPVYKRLPQKRRKRRRKR
jgi:hypothetical protein